MRSVLQVLREPAQLLGLVAGGLALFSALVLPLSATQQGVVVAAVTTVLGFIGALAVSREKAAMAVAGLVQALLALALAFGAHLQPDTQGSIMAFVATAVGFYLRTQVTPRVPEPAGGDIVDASPDPDGVYRVGAHAARES